MDECVFCKLAKGGEHMIFENRLCFVVLDKYPAERGHMLVIPKKHYQDMLEAPDSVIAGVYETAKKFGNMAKERLGADGVNIETNIGRIAGQFVMHFHVHVIPRYKKRGERVFDHEEELSESDAKGLRKLLKD
ncbi:MAG: HIT domain-containing protein [Candidatus Micrarchaeota archaeon]|nr:HIT domain-containing protein [Candidatus Micrarchaeota archaeon]